MPRTRRASRKQRGGFLDSLFGSLFGEKKSNNSSGQDSLEAPVSANTVYTNASVGGKRRKSRKSKKAHRKAKAHRKSRMNRKAYRKSRRNTRRH